MEIVVSISEITYEINYLKYINGDSDKGIYYPFLKGNNVLTEVRILLPLFYMINLHFLRTVETLWNFHRMKEE